ncbi:CDP-diacylglycerol--glycerol-3-phosphate 3-phosphatidyltransferase [Parafrankia soli]|uniref:CDP-diacylglycerol--glycerol-3-phosphate 3-phosphatidyltransferase n=1 Tax=Parafrankia soli TaxID=2599596 RepID=A0A1S1Q7Z0_9ACTN|nr:CDP-alcohol phosphatidyltransferase family protein [Parafrankia soli]OHV28314.1 CDP-diacylglycerol--glycerol-3-phosphate 3-phosphatidyltransferase [Parafrankia soli]CAI7978845.1 putative cardiolipin synthase [Frankia sp. Hr75.2]
MTAETQASDRIWTIPNLLSGLRLLGVPLFLWLALGPEADGAALGVLAFAGISDYLDGKLARVLNQTSRLGVTLDPLADRLYIFATIAALTLRDIVPLWFALALVARDVALLGLVPVLRRLGVGTALPVHYLGKAATFNLLYAFPLLLLSAGDSWLATAARPLGWAFAIWGIALYWWSGLLYAEQARRLAGERARLAAARK